MSDTKQIGIAVDNYKIKRFTKALADAGYTDVTVTPLDSIGAKATSLLSVKHVPATYEAVHGIHDLCAKLQHEFAHRN